VYGVPQIIHKGTDARNGQAEAPPVR
jgi:hypothetical protein